MCNIKPLGYFCEVKTLLNWSKIDQMKDKPRISIVQYNLPLRTPL